MKSEGTRVINIPSESPSGNTGSEKNGSFGETSKPVHLDTVGFSKNNSEELKRRMRVTRER